jgi:hypothetical protein
MLRHQKEHVVSTVLVPLDETAFTESILPYEAVRLAPSPDQMILDFFQSTYEVGATLAGWDRAALERPNPLHRQTDDRR